MRCTLTLIGLIAFVLSASPAIGGGTQYHIRVFYNAGGGAVINGLSEIADTAGQQGFSDAARTGRVEADLSTGQLRTFNDVNVPVSGFLIALTEFSDTFTVRNGAGTTFGFDFDIDGSIMADALSVAGNIYQIDMFANLAVFPAGVSTVALVEIVTIAPTLGHRAFLPRCSDLAVSRLPQSHRTDMA